MLFSLLGPMYIFDYIMDGFGRQLPVSPHSTHNRWKQLGPVVATVVSSTLLNTVGTNGFGCKCGVLWLFSVPCRYHLFEWGPPYAVAVYTTHVATGV